MGVTEYQIQGGVKKIKIISLGKGLTEYEYFLVSKCPTVTPYIFQLLVIRSHHHIYHHVLPFLPPHFQKSAR